MAKRINTMAPYHVQMREAERRLIRSALDQAVEQLGPVVAPKDQLAMAATILGVQAQYVRARGILLGGVFKDDPKHEPPGKAEDAWIAAGRRDPNA